MVTENATDVAEDSRNRELAAAKLVTILRRREAGTLQVESASVYGSALAIPQLARTAGWPREFRHLVFRTYIFLLLTFFMQMAFLYLINKEQIVWDRFAGQMYLCDFGAGLKGCPDGPGCTGPGGGKYTPSGLYNFKTWVNRKFSADSLKAVFPKEAKEHEDYLNPGEFGVESHSCRFLACFLFTISAIPEFVGCLNLAKLLVVVPSEDQPWMDYDVPTWSSSKDKAKSIRGWSELDLVSLKIAGMSMKWKIVNGILLLLPKAAILFLTLLAGTTFLMETSGIDNMLVNSTALAFILNIDEMLFGSVATRATHHMLDNMQGFPLYDEEADEKITDEEVLKNYEEVQKASPFSKLSYLLPMRLLVAIVVATISIYSYYIENCEPDKDGIYISKPMYAPLSVNLNIWDSLLPMLFQAGHEEEPYWVMPSED